MAIEILSQFLDLQSNYKKLRLEHAADGDYVIFGTLEFEATNNNISIQDAFEIEVHINNDYPKRLPTVKETGGKIPKNFHTNQDGFLCLGSSLAIKEAFQKKPNLTGFIENVAVPFFYSFCYWEKFKVMPFDELPHGTEGILWDYKNRFSLSSDITAIKLLNILAENSYRGHSLCPCESGKRFRDCHGNLVIGMQGLQEQEDFLCDYLCCYGFLIGKKVLGLPNLETPRLGQFIKTLGKRQAELIRKIICQFHTFQNQ